MRLQQELDLAKRLANEAGEVQLNYLAKDKKVDIKDDQSPVSEIDLKCEKLIIEGLQQQFPEDAILSEEVGEIGGNSGRQWIIDPIDGTRPYLKGIPTFSTLIALFEGNEPLVGIIHLPGLAKTFWASKGNGSFFNGQAIHVSKTKHLNQAMGTGHGFIAKYDTLNAKALLSSMCSWNFTYGFMDAFTYGVLASGSLDLCVSLTDKPWDCAPAACIVTEAGGCFSDINGEKTIFSGNFVASNGLLHEEILADIRQRLESLS